MFNPLKITRNHSPAAVRWLRGGVALLLLASALPAGDAALAAPAAPNANPVAVDDAMYAFVSEGYQKLYVLDNDSDADAGDTLQVTNVTFAAHGSAVGDFFSVDYKPFAGYVGTDSFNYTVSDGHGHTDVGHVVVTVAASGSTSVRTAIYAGPDDRLLLTVTPKGGGPSDANSGACNGTTAGLAIEDGILSIGNGTRFNPFDNGMTIFINGNQLPPELPMSITHHNVASGPHTMAGLQVGLAYFGVRSDFTLRTLLSLTNDSGSSKSVTVTVATNVGSDNFTGIRGTSSGDLNFTAADRWVVTSDHDNSQNGPGYVVSTHVLYGPGSPPVTPYNVSQTVFECSGKEGILARFHVTIPNGQTRRLLFFNQFHFSNTAAVSDAALFNQTPVGELEGLTTSQLSQVVNWNIGPISYLFVPLVER